MRYEFAYLYFYRPTGKGTLYNFRIDEPLTDYNDGMGLPYILQRLSDEGWRIVHTEKHTPEGDSDYDWLVWLQREITVDDLIWGHRNA